MGRITMVLSNKNIEDVPDEKGIYSIFFNRKGEGDSLLCISVKFAVNIKNSVKSYIRDNEQILNYLNSGLPLLLIYEPLIDFENYEIEEKEKEWELIYKPKYKFFREKTEVIV